MLESDSCVRWPALPTSRCCPATPRCKRASVRVPRCMQVVWEKEHEHYEAEKARAESKAEFEVGEMGCWAGRVEVLTDHSLMQLRPHRPPPLATHRRRSRPTSRRCRCSGGWVGGRRGAPPLQWQRERSPARVSATNPPPRLCASPLPHARPLHPLTHTPTAPRSKKSTGSGSPLRSST